MTTHLRRTLMSIILGFIITYSSPLPAQVKSAASGNWNTASTWIKYRTGTATFTNGSTTVSGSGTLFLSELQVGNTLVLQSSPSTVRGTIASIASNTSLTLAANATASTSGSFGIQSVPAASDSVFIVPGTTVTAASGGSCAGLTMEGGNSAATLNINSGVTITVSGPVKLVVPQTGNTTNLISIGAGTLNAGSVEITGGLNSKISEVLISSGTMNVSGSFIFPVSGTPVGQKLTFTGAGTANIGGDLTNNGTLTTFTGCTINFNGTGAQSIGAYTTYSDLTVNKSSGTATLLGAITVGRNLTITAGMLADNGFQITGNAVGTMSMGSTGVLILGSGSVATLFPTLYIPASISLHATSTVIYDATPSQTLAHGHRYGHFKIRGGGKTVAGGMNVDGDFSIDPGSTFPAGSHSHAVKGHFTNNGTLTQGTSTFTFNGGAGQTVGGSSPVTFNNITVANPSGVTLGRSVQTDGTLSLESGNLGIGSNTLTINGSVSTAGGGLAGGTTSDLVIGGSGGTLTIPSVEVNNLSVNRANGLTLGGTLATNGNVTLTVGLVTVGANGITIKRPIMGTRTNLRANNSSTVKISGNTSGIILPGSITQLGTLEVDNTSGATLEAPLSVTTGLSLMNGTLNNSSFSVTIENGATVSPGGGGLSSPPSYAGPVNLTYTNTTPLSTGSEMPTDPATLNNLTINGSGAVSLSNSVTVNGTLTLTSGTLEIGNKTLTLKGPVTRTGGILTGSSSSTILVTGSGGSVSIPAVNTGTLQINRAGGASFDGNVTVGTSLQLTSGTLSIGSNTLTINGGLTLTGGLLTGGPTSNITIGGTGTTPSIPGIDLGILEVNRSSGLSITGGVTVGSQLILTNGTLNTGGNPLTLGTSPTSRGTLSRSAGMINGCFRRWIGAETSENNIFPLAGAPAYSPANMSFTAAPTGGTLTGCFNPVDPGMAGFPLNDGGTILENIWPGGYWTITQGDGLSGGTYAAEFTTAIGSGVSNYQSLRIVKRANSSVNWSADGAHVTATGSNSNPTVKRSDLTSFSDFAIAGTSENALPVQIASFTAQYASSLGVRLEWTTVSEVNNFGFHVQRKAPGQGSFTTIAGSFVPGHGTTIVPQNYSYDDHTAPPGTWHYRLEQIDLDGSMNYSDPVEVDVLTSAGEESVEISAFALHQNYPNPFNPGTTVSYDLAQRSLVSLRVFNLIGQEVTTLVSGERAAGRHVEAFLANQLPSGVYLYVLHAAPPDGGRGFTAKRTMLLMK